MKGRHRQLITELAKDLKLDVPQQMMVAFDDHPTPPANALATVVPNNPNVARPGPGSSGSLRQKMEERKNSNNNRPGSKNSASSLRDRMKARRGNN